MQTDLFDVAEGRRRKENGIAAASIPRQELLKLARQIAVRAADNGNLTCTADDVQAGLRKHGIASYQIGNAMGSIFRGKCWSHVGWTESKRPEAHGRAIRVWMLDPSREDHDG